MFDPNYSMEDQGQQQQQPVAAAPPANNDDHIAPDVDGFGLDGFPEGHHLRIQEQLLRSQQQQRNYVRRHHVARRRQRHPSHHKIQKRPSLTTTPSASSSMTTTAARTTSATSTASAPASTSASASATAPASASASASALASASASASALASASASAPSFPWSRRALSPSAQHVFDKVTHEFRLHNPQQEALQLEAQSLVQQEQQQQQRKEHERQQEPLSPPTAMLLVPDTAATTTVDHQSWAGIGSLEVDDGIEMDDASELDDAKLQSLLPPSFRHINYDYSSSVAPTIPVAASSALANTAESKGKRPERRQLKHNAQTQSRSIQAMVEEMIETGTQCNVRSAPLPAPSAPVLSTLDDLKVDHGYDFASMELEVDERYRDGTVDVLEEERALLESMQVRRAGNGPAGIRKHTAEGTLPLRYQLSAEAALRCATVVRSKPRMRRRKEHGTGSVTSSVAYSTNSSPMAQPVQPSEQLQSQYLPAIPSSSYHTPP